VFTFAFLGLRISLFDFCWPLAMVALLPGANAPRWPHHNLSAAGFLSGEAFLEVGPDRSPGEMRVDVGIAFLPKGLANVLEAGEARGELECTFDDVRALHWNS
jgi:hypothetical protein